LGVFYYNKAWKKRGTKISSKLSTKQTQLFISNLERSIQYFNNVQGLLFEEAQSRLIAVYNGLGKREMAKQSFILTTKKSKDNLQAFLNYSEVVLPKWGGSHEEFKQFYSQLPNQNWIKKTLQAKEIHDNWHEFPGSLGLNYPQFTKDFIVDISLSLDKQPFESPHKYILYGYLYMLSYIVNEPIYIKKYKKLLNNNFAIFPYGVNA